MSREHGSNLINLSQAVVIVPPDLSGPEKKAVTMLVDEVEKRTRILWECTTTWPSAPAPVVGVGPASALPGFAGSYADELTADGEASAAEGYRIRIKGGGDSPAIFVIGNDARGVLFGVGHLLRTLRMDQGSIALPDDLNVTTAPYYQLRGHQLGYRDKTNSYCGWDLPQWEQYFRDLAVFGANAIELIPPRSDDKPDSVHFPRPPLEMMAGMSKLADEYGLVFSVALMAVLRSDSISPAFPDLARALHQSSESVGLLITVFALPSVFLVPVLGILADRWGRKRVLVPSLLLFGLAGGACSLVQSFDLLLTLRFLQGVGAASLSMLNITLIADLYVGAERTAAMGYNASVRSVGSTLNPLVGGALATLGWYYPFALSLLAVPVAFLVLLVLKNPEPRRDQRFGEYLNQARESLKRREVVGLFFAGCVVFITMFGAYLAYFPFLLEGAFGASPLVIGLMVSGRSVVNAVIAARLGRIATVFRESSLVKVSFVLYALVFAMIPLAPSLRMMAIITLLLGTAEGLYWPSSHALLGRLAPLEHRAGFMAVNDTVLKLGQTLGPLLMGAVFGRWGIEGAFYAAAGFALVAFGLTTALIEPV